MSGLISTVASILVQHKIERWLTQHGVDTEIGYLHFSIPHLSLLARGVSGQNRDGRGFHAREVLLDYSWWQLLHGRITLQRVVLDGAYMDLESRPGGRGRLWEIGGWAQKPGPRRDRDLQLLFDRVRIHDSRLCYRHRPQWPTPSCVQFRDLRARDLLIGLARQGAEPLSLKIGADKLQLRELLLRDGGDTADTALVKLDLDEALFTRPGNSITAASVTAQRFASCPPQRWAEALPGLGRLPGHCASARELQLRGELRFAFGAAAAVHWQRARGSGITLRDRNRRWPNWHAQTLAMSEFDFLRSDRHLNWQRATASGFDWCPPGLRRRGGHYCVRAGNLKLPRPVVFDWREQLRVEAGGGRLRRVQLLDLAGAKQKPLTAREAELGAFEYRAATRILRVDSLDLASADGCVPARLWQGADYCARVAGLHGSEALRLRFPSQRTHSRWGFASGPLQLAQLRLQRDGAAPLQLQNLHWQQIDLLGGEQPLLLRDVGLDRLSGCAPPALLPARWRPLCAEVAHLDGRGNFAWRGGAEGYAILGELRLQHLQLSDRRGGSGGLRLRQLHTGAGFLRRQRDVDNPWIDNSAAATPADPAKTAPATAGKAAGKVAGEVAGEAADKEPGEGLEKGMLQRELAARAAEAAAGASGGGAPASASDPNLKLQTLSLTSVRGCLPGSWARLLYRDARDMPTCFDLHDLRQHRPLRIAWQGGLDLRAAQLTLERAQVTTATGRALLQLEQLRVPRAQVTREPGAGRMQVALPDFALRRFRGCLPERVASGPLQIRCADLRALHTGPDFAATLDRRALRVDLDRTLAGQILLQRRGGGLAAELREFVAPQLRLVWPRQVEHAASAQLENISAAQLRGCLPPGKKLRAGLPRCFSSRNLRSSDGGFALGETVLAETPEAPPLWRIASLAVGELALTPEALVLRGLQIHDVLVCGVQQWLPAARDSGLADCISAQQLEIAGASRIGLGDAAPRLQLGALQSAPITLRRVAGSDVDPGTGKGIELGLRRLSWQQLRWNGGAALWVTDLALSGLRGCMPGPLRQLVAGAGRGETAGGRRCIDLHTLRLPGTQQLVLAAPFSSSGAIELQGLAIDRGSGAPWKFARIRLEQFAFGGDGPLGRAAGLSGCLPPGLLGDSRLAPCYRSGPVQLDAVERRQTPAGRITELRGLHIDGLELRQPDYPAGLPAQLLQIQDLGAARLRIGAGNVVAEQLRLDGVAGCVPRGYIGRLNHCANVAQLNASGSFRSASGALKLEQLALRDIRVVAGDGRRLVRGDSLRLEAFVSSGRGVRLQSLQAEAFSFLGRRETAPEFERHAWSGELQQLQVSKLNYDSEQRALDIHSIRVLKPRGILMRDRKGQFPLRAQLAALTGQEPAAEGERPKERLGDRLTSELSIHYHIGSVDLSAGSFTWVDRLGQYRGRLPVRLINLSLRNASNRAEDKPAEILLNARPGGFGELQLAGSIDYLDTRKWNANLTGYINNANLIPATPYMANLLGYKILQGQLDALLDIKVKENKVDAMAKMVLNRIRVRRVRDSDQLPVKSSFIPLGIALELLKNGQGNVSFDMPVSGDLYDPKLSFSFIFSDLLQRAIMEALFSYFTPIGFYSLAKLAWARFRAVHFDPIEFDPGSAELDTHAERQLRDMLETLRARPDARPGICGGATALDWHALYPQDTPPLRGSRKARETFYRYPPVELFEELERLAQKRSRAIEHFLLDNGISANEFIQCAPDYNGRDFENPRVEFSR
ncbi:DUF748 domain-containing protein [Microbulbifer sp. SAOS-129_SWC]|uniref:DUF748 domain-containing protein n=1 Tax=Microbulbifer sp. SAOS-129_SWC TaxID=3145235 RepID=UPI0032176869